MNLGDRARWPRRRLDRAACTTRRRSPSSSSSTRSRSSATSACSRSSTTPASRRTRRSAPALVRAGRAAQDVPRPLDAELPLRRGRLLALHPAPRSSRATRRSSPSARSGDLLRQHGRDRARAASAVTLDRRTSPDARARADAAALGDRVAARRRRRLLARRPARPSSSSRSPWCYSGSASASTGRRTRRSSPTSARRTCVAATSPCTRSRGGSPGRSGPRVGGLHPRGGAVRPLAARLLRLPDRRGSECSRSSATSRATCSESRAKRRSPRSPKRPASEPGSISPWSSRADSRDDGATARTSASLRAST